MDEISLGKSFQVTPGGKNGDCQKNVSNGPAGTNWVVLVSCKPPGEGNGGGAANVAVHICPG